MSDWACCKLTAGFTLAMTVYQVEPRSCAKGASKGAGDQMSTSDEGNRNDGGMTPTMVAETDPKRRVLPSAFGLAAKRLFQNRSLMMTA